MPKYTVLGLYLDNQQTFVHEVYADTPKQAAATAGLEMAESSGIVDPEDEDMTAAERLSTVSGTIQILDVVTGEYNSTCVYDHAADIYDVIQEANKERAQAQFTTDEEHFYKNHHDKCPVCQVGDPDYGSMELNCDEVTQEVFCPNCGTEWIELYELYRTRLLKRGDPNDNSN